MKAKWLYILSVICLALSVLAYGLADSGGSAGPGTLSLLTPAGPDSADPEALKKSPRLLHARHKIGTGEKLGTLAELYGTNESSLKAANSSDFIVMRAGGYIRVHNGRGYLYEVPSDAETFYGVTARFRPKSEDLRSFREAVVRDNGLPPSSLLRNFRLKRGQRLLLRDVYPRLDTYRLPVAAASFRISSSYGYRYHPVLKKRIFHKGCDIPMPVGSPVYAARSGVVVFSGWRKGYGRVVEVRHSDGSRTRYGHLSSSSVRRGQAVIRSETLLGKVGSTGLSTGPHLHFEIINAAGRPVNPLSRLGKR